MKKQLPWSLRNKYFLIVFFLIPQAILKNTKSPHCWFVMGQINRLNRSNEDANKNFKQAIRLDPSNVSILRDMASLQAHNQDWSEHLQTRQKLFDDKNTILLNWSGLAFANYFAEDFETAFELVDSFMKVTDDNKDTKLSQSEKSELLLMQAHCLRKQSKLQELSDFLKKNET